MIAGRFRDFFGSLTIRLVALLSLALMPIGAIAVFQTSQLSAQLRTEARTSLLGRTFDAIEYERSVIERAFGAAEMLGFVTTDFQTEMDLCRAAMNEVVDGTQRYSFAGVLEEDLVLRCSSAPDWTNASEMAGVSEIYAAGVPAATAYANPPRSETAIFAVFQPVYIDEMLSHFIVLSIPQYAVSPELGEDEFGDALSLLVFNRGGEVLNSELSEERLRQGMPVDVKLSGLLGGDGQVFEGVTADGDARVFSIVPIYGNVVYALASWDPDTVGLPSAKTRITPWLFPIIMWLATLIVTYFAINRLVVRHVLDLGFRMRAFARNRRFTSIPKEVEQPAEFQDMNRNFEVMADAILHDEAELEDMLREKNLLIREVHHRVKNNLQLIASIMNMQARKTRSPETAYVIRRLQDRVLGLAAIYRRMYESHSLSEMPVAELIETLLSQALTMGPPDKIQHSFHIEKMSLIPDQAVPLALLAAETGANAVRHIGAPEGQSQWLEARLSKDADGTILFEVRNSLSVPADDADVPGEPQGLGTQLIRAFVNQLRGSLETKTGVGTYTVTTKFRPEAPQQAQEVQADREAGLAT